MHELVQRQRDYFLAGNTRHVSNRIQALKQLKKLLYSNSERLDEAIFKDFGKSSFDNFTTELGLILTEINFAISHLKTWSKPQKTRTNLINFPGKSYRYPEPLGVTLVIGAWNYPYQLVLIPAVSSIAAGNTVIIKPSELCPHVSALLEELLHAAFDPSLLCVVTGGIPETSALLEQRFDKIFFTGSTHVGKIVYQAAAKHLTPVTLELGGKSPAIITESAAIHRSAQRLVWAKFLNAGQTCIAPDYVYVHSRIREKFIRALHDEIRKQNFAITHQNYVQIINTEHFDRLTKLIDPDKISFGGKTNREQRWIEPTILTNISWNDRIMQEEIFGPVLPVLTYSDPEEVIREIQSRERPLSCYIFTTRKTQEKQLLESLSFGGGCINDAIMHITNHHLSFGGIGNSGTGAYHGKHGFDTFTHYKSILRKPNWLELSLKYGIKSKRKLAWVRRIMGV